MKILLTLDYPPEKGGVQRYLFDKVVHTFGPDDAVMVGSARKGLAPARTSWTGPGTCPCPVFRHTNPLSPLNKKWSIVNLVVALAVKRRKNPDALIYCGNVYAAIAPWIFSYFEKLRYRVYVYGGELLCLGKGRNLRSVIFRKILLRADAIHAIGTYATQLIKDAGIVKEIVLDPPRIDLQKKEFSAKPMSPGDCPLHLLSVGRLVVHKGHAVLLEAVSLLPVELDWRLVIVGSGPEEDRLKAIVADNKLSARVTLKTGLDDSALEEEYRTADIFILPSLTTADNAEGFGIVLLEAAAHGLPIVASRVGGVPEVLDNGACGSMVGPGDPVALGAAVLALSLDKDQREEFAHLAYRRVKERYAW